MKKLGFAAILAVVSATVFACGGDGDGTTSAAAGANSDAGAPSENAGGASTGGAPAGKGFELIGSYVDSFGSEQIITARDWNGSTIAGYDNDANVVYTQFPKDDMFNPNKFAKTVYTEPKNGSFYFCMVEYSLATLTEAKASKTTADDSDPENAGCGAVEGAAGAASSGFPWTKATAK